MSEKQYETEYNVARSTGNPVLKKSGQTPFLRNEEAKARQWIFGKDNHLR